MQGVEDHNPPWLKPLLEATFFLDCQTHKNPKNSHCNYYCLECTGNSFCVYCSTDHAKHQTIQIRRSSLSDGVKVDEIAEYINVGAIQTYVINSGKIVFLNSRAYKGLPYGVINTCDICHRSLPTSNFKFCSLGCKRDAINGGFTKETFVLVPKLSTGELHNSFQVNQLSVPENRLKMRKLDILLSQSPTGTTSVGKEISNDIGHPTPLKFNHVNSRKRKGIPRRAPLM